MPCPLTRRLFLLTLSIGLTFSSRIYGEGLLPDTAWEEPLAVGLQAAPVSFSGMPTPSPSAFGQQPMAPPTQYVLPTPQAAPENVPPPVNGTWRDDGQYVIIEVNGQQLRLLKRRLPNRPRHPLAKPKCRPARCMAACLRGAGRSSTARSSLSPCIRTGRRTTMDSASQ